MSEEKKTSGQETAELDQEQMERVSGGAGEQEEPRDSELDQGGETMGGVGGYGDKDKRRP